MDNSKKEYSNKPIPHEAESLIDKHHADIGIAVTTFYLQNRGLKYSSNATYIIQAWNEFEELMERYYND